MEVRYDETKFAEMLLHVAGRLKDDHAGGASKLNKLLFFAEFTHLRRHHEVISGCEFQKLAHGPAPRQLVPVRGRLLELGHAELVEEDRLGRPQHRLVPRRLVDTEVFESGELSTIDGVLDQLAGLSESELSALVDEEPGCRLARVGETIPHATAFLGYPQIATPTTRQLAAEVAAHYGLLDAG